MQISQRLEREGRWGGGGGGGHHSAFFVCYICLCVSFLTVSTAVIILHENLGFESLTAASHQLHSYITFALLTSSNPGSNYKYQFIVDAKHTCSDPVCKQNKSRRRQLFTL